MKRKRKSRGGRLLTGTRKERMTKNSSHGVEAKQESVKTIVNAQSLCNYLKTFMLWPKLLQKESQALRMEVARQAVNSIKSECIM